MSLDFSTTFYLRRAKIYNDPKRSNDKLPIVYGDLTDHTNGVWELPCIDTASYVYCFADHETLTSGNGNSINVYIDGVDTPAGGNWSFNPQDDYETQGNISTITFTADQENKKISVRGKGKQKEVPDEDVLIENIIDIVEDFLTEENTFELTEFESTLKEIANSKFETQGYKAAGIIADDVGIWEILQDMMGSFLGNIYLNGQRKLVLEIDDNTVETTPQMIINKADIKKIKAIQKLENIVNQCPCEYSYNYAESEFLDSTDEVINTASQNVYGVRKPLKPISFLWSRDLTTVSGVQNILVEKFNEPVWEITITVVTLKELALDVGDMVATTINFLYDSDNNQYINQLLKVISVKPQFDKNIIEFKCLDTGNFLLGDDLASFWRFDEGTGTTAYDSSQFRNNGTLVNTPTWAVGVSKGRCLSFDGVNERVNCGSAILNSDNQDFSVSLWAYRNENTYEGLVAKDPGGGANRNWFLMGFTNNNIKIVVWETDGNDVLRYSAANSFPLSTWTHIGLVVDCTNHKLYSIINGIRTDITGAWDGTSKNEVIDLTIGWNYNNTYAFNGKIDEVRVYSRALSQNDITYLYNNIDCRDII